MFAKRITHAGAALLVCAMAACAAADKAHPVALMKAGPVDDALVERLKSWVENELALPCPLIEHLDAANESLDEIAEAAAQRLGPEDLGVVVLYQSAGEVAHHGIYRPEQRVVVINVNAMKEGADEEKTARRLERQVIRGIGVLMGLEWSPNPTSAMAPYTTLEELDQIGRNLDPPWQLKLHQRARELGVPVDADNPYYMLRNE